MTSVICPYFFTMSFSTTVLVTMPAAPRPIHGFKSTGSPANQTAGLAADARFISAAPIGMNAESAVPFVEIAVCCMSLLSAMVLDQMAGTP